MMGDQRLNPFTDHFKGRASRQGFGGFRFFSFFLNILHLKCKSYVKILDHASVSITLFYLWFAFDIINTTKVML